jgi:hypothetical protein
MFAAKTSASFVTRQKFAYRCDIVRRQVYSNCRVRHPHSGKIGPADRELLLCKCKYRRRIESREGIDGYCFNALARLANALPRRGQQPSCDLTT